MGLKLKIGAKFALASGVGILLVVGMILAQRSGNTAVETSTVASDAQRAMVEELLAAQSEIRSMQIAYRAIRMARTPEAAAAAVKSLKEAGEQGAARLDAAAAQVADAPVRERLGVVKASLATYVTDIEQVAQLQAEILTQQQRQIAVAEAWRKGWMAAFTAPELLGLPERGEVTAVLLEADANISEIRGYFWQYLATSDKALVARKAQLEAKALDKINQFMTMTSIDVLFDRAMDLAKIVAGIKASINRLIDLDGEQDRLIAAATPVRIEMEKLIGEAIAQARAASKQTDAAAVATLTTSGRVSLAIGAFVALVLCASAAFAGFSIARPVSRIAEVLMVLAGGDKSVAIPFTSRGDEVGDAARAAHAFRDNIVRMEAMEAEQRAAQARAGEERRLADERVAASRKAADDKAAAERRAAMLDLAERFEAAVGGIISTVSATAGELERAAGTLTQTADTTQGLSTSVAAAAEQASANVDEVAGATDKLTSSVGEIARQVQASSRIATEAVAQAETTDTRITALSQAASRIGDVVKLITAIAEQTNLLALNATIEAARAGDAGRGFAVVASEVKALAAQTAKATDEIGTQIAGMQSATDVSVAAIKEIAGTIRQVADIAGSITAAVDEQDAATAEIARNVQQAARGTAQVAANITDVNRGAAETGTASTQVLESARALAQQSGSLRAEVDRFLATVRAA